MALSIAPVLGPPQTLVAVGSGCAVEPLRASGLFRQVVSVTDGTHDAEITALLDGGEVRRVADVGVAEPRTWDECARAGVELLLVEMFLWRRDRAWIRRTVAAGARLVVVAYPGVEHDLRRVGLEVGAAIVVPPLIGRVPPASGTGTGWILVSLGGADSPFVSYADNRYPEVVAALLHRMAPALGGAREVRVCCGQAMADRLRAKGPRFPGSVGYFDRQEYLRQLGGAAVVLAQPSIYTPYEAFGAGVPTILLPPQNFTQCFHLVQWRGWGFGLPGTNLLELDAGLALDPHAAEGPQEIAVQQSLARLLGMPLVLNDLADAYSAEVRGALETRRGECLDRQREAWDRLGGSTGVDVLARVLAGSTPAPTAVPTVR